MSMSLNYLFGRSESQDFEGRKEGGKSTCSLERREREGVMTQPNPQWIMKFGALGR